MLAAKIRGKLHDFGYRNDPITCCVSTTAANELVGPYQDRMPALLAPGDSAKWFGHDAELAEAQALLKPRPAELMTVSEANVLANGPRNEGPQLLEPAA
jgi:putative SOS response-associated peptidase YedK